MKKKNSDIFQQALGEATHKPTDNWEKELDKAKQTKNKAYVQRRTYQRDYLNTAGCFI